jgi:uncharacterized protein YeaO (DUF488 family)
MRPGINIKRIYEEIGSHDGYRVLVDSLWPRGFTRKKAHIDEWAVEIAPSTAIKLAYAHIIPKRWNTFNAQYKNDLILNEQLISYLDHPILTLLYSKRITSMHVHSFCKNT